MCHNENSRIDPTTGTSVDAAASSPNIRRIVIEIHEDVDPDAVAQSILCSLAKEMAV